MAAVGRHLNRAEVMVWRDSWSFIDRERITAALDAIPGGVSVLPPSGDYIGVWSDGRQAMTIQPGWLSWRGGRFTGDLPPDLFPDMQANEQFRWHLLSTFRPREGGSPKVEPAQTICPIHGMELPATGICDDCA